MMLVPVTSDLRTYRIMRKAAIFLGNSALSVEIILHSNNQVFFLRGECFIKQVDMDLRFALERSRRPVNQIFLSWFSWPVLPNIIAAVASDLGTYYPKYTMTSLLFWRREIVLVARLFLALYICFDLTVINRWVCRSIWNWILTRINRRQCERVEPPCIWNRHSLAFWARRYASVKLLHTQPASRLGKYESYRENDV